MRKQVISSILLIFVTFSAKASGNGDIFSDLFGNGAFDVYDQLFAPRSCVNKFLQPRNSRLQVNTNVTSFSAAPVAAAHLFLSSYVSMIARASTQHPQSLDQFLLELSKFAFMIRSGNQESLDRYPMAYDRWFSRDVIQKTNQLSSAIDELRLHRTYQYTLRTDNSTFGNATYARDLNPLFNRVEQLVLELHDSILASAAQQHWFNPAREARERVNGLMASFDFTIRAFDYTERNGRLPISITRSLVQSLAGQMQILIEILRRQGQTQYADTLNVFYQREVQAVLNSLGIPVQRDTYAPGSYVEANILRETIELWKSSIQGQFSTMITRRAEAPPREAGANSGFSGGGLFGSGTSSGASTAQTARPQTPSGPLYQLSGVARWQDAPVAADRYPRSFENWQASLDGRLRSTILRNRVGRRNVFDPQTRMVREIGPEQGQYLWALYVFGYTTLPDATTLNADYRRLQKTAHPDVTGNASISHEYASSLNIARGVLLDVINNGGR